MKELYIESIADRLGVKAWQVESCVQLLEDGASVPFISRYRKERTGGLDDEQVAMVKHISEEYREMEKRKETILATISEAGALTEELKAEIENTLDASHLEDLYLPWRPKRKTRASEAVAKGLEPLTEAILSRKPFDDKFAEKFVTELVPSAAEALQGARDIIAERISECIPVREELRRTFRERRIVSKATKAEDSPEKRQFSAYFNYSAPLAKIQPHNLLAILRGEDQGFLSVKIDSDPQKAANQIVYQFCTAAGYPSQEGKKHLRMAAEDSYKRLLEPSITGEVIREAKLKADIASIAIFGDNLRQLLLAPPVGQKRTMAIDPGFRTGCKVVCLDAQGKLLEHDVIFPHPPQSKKIQSIQTVSDLAEKYDIEVVAIGNGTAGRETDAFIRRVGLEDDVKIYSVSEDGASIYSASDIAREEFPDEDVTVRGAVSIGRRLMDPLAELVKIDPKSLGVGQYQHDVDQKLLQEKLDDTVEYCVNSVGVQLNTASEYLLRYVSGIGPSLASAIVRYRSENGPYTSREQLLNVPRLGAKAFQQCAGFLRIRGAENPLDNSAVHPEAYGLVDRIARDKGVTTAELVGNEALCKSIRAEDYVTSEFGLPTISDILKELAKPGVDPREDASEFSFSESVHDIEDLHTGMVLPGIVTNITAFGAFVDIGVHQDGLIHVSRMGVPGLSNPAKVVRLRQGVTVEVIAIDLDRRRISLELK